jgi:hypothetical protein
VTDDLPVQTGDEDLLGQIDGVEDGEVTGWACLKGYMAKPLEVCRHPCCCLSIMLSFAFYTEMLQVLEHVSK